MADYEKDSDVIHHESHIEISRVELGFFQKKKKVELGFCYWVKSWKFEYSSKIKNNNVLISAGRKIKKT